MPNKSLFEIMQGQVSAWDPNKQPKIGRIEELPGLTYSKNSSVAGNKTDTGLAALPAVSSNTGTKTSKDLSFGTKAKGFLTKNSGIIDAVSSGLNVAQSALHNRTGLQKSDEGALAVKNAQFAIGEKIPVIGGFVKAAKLVDSALGAITGGLGRATTADKLFTSMPIFGNLIAGFTGKTDTFKGNIQDINTGDFGGVVADATRAQELSGVKSVAKGRLNRQIRNAQNDFLQTADLITRNQKFLNNNIGSDLFTANLNKYQGNQQLSLAKQGMKFPDLETARNILSSIKSKEIQSFKSGGKIEKENIIPTGALHKNLHHIEDANPDLEGKITKKGIPVGTYSDGGEFHQQAEVESHEWTMSLDSTKKVEEYHENYKETGDDNIAIECGKFLVDQIFNNTRDDDKVIKKTE